MLGKYLSDLSWRLKGVLFMLRIIMFTFMHDFICNESSTPYLLSLFLFMYFFVWERMRKSISKLVITARRVFVKRSRRQVIQKLISSLSAALKRKWLTGKNIYFFNFNLTANQSSANTKSWNFLICQTHLVGFTIIKSTVLCFFRR